MAYVIGIRCLSINRASTKFNNLKVVSSPSSPSFLIILSSFLKLHTPLTSPSLYQSQHQYQTRTITTCKMSPSSQDQEKDQEDKKTSAATANAKSSALAQGHADQDVKGEHNDWKFRAPYKVHENGGESGFRALYEGACHCGRVKYQLGREKPLGAKFCHCGTCRVLHGESCLGCVFWEGERREEGG